jgi:hypothetical protein
MADSERHGGGGQQRATAAIGDGDHLLTANSIEEAFDSERTEKAGYGKRQKMPGDLFVGDVKECLADQAIAEEDCIEEKSLGNHQDQAKLRSLAIFTQHVAGDVSPRRVIPHLDLQIFSGSPSGFGSESGALRLASDSISSTTSSARVAPGRAGSASAGSPAQ